MTGSPSTAASTAFVYWLKLIVAVLAVKGLLFWGDHHPMFFLGDSVSYLWTATSKFIPADRSFIYGWIIRDLAVKWGTLTTLLAAQTLASAVCALLCTYVLRRYFGVSRGVAAVMGLLCAVEPLQLLYERYVMTEAFSLLVFAVFTTLALGYLKRPSLLWIVLVQVAGVVLVSLRVSFLPVIEATTVLAPALALGGLGRQVEEVRGQWFFMKPLWPSGHRWWSFLAHLVLSCALFVGLHDSYKRIYAGYIQEELPEAPPAYYYENGYHLLGFFAPIVEPGDFSQPDKADQIFRNLAYDLRDYHTRGQQRWLGGGLVANVRWVYPDPLEANRVAEQAAWHAVKRDPVGEVWLAMKGYGDYWRLERLRRGLITDRGGDRELPPELLSMLVEYFNVTDGASLPHLSTITNQYFFHAWGWYLALLLLPAAGLWMIRVAAPGQRPGAILLCVLATLQIVVIAAFSLEPTVRFLHSVAWLGLITGGVLWSRILGWRAARHEAGSSHEPGRSVVRRR